MQCTWGHSDCKNLESRCHTCFSEDLHYESSYKAKPKQVVKKRTNASSKRMGSIFEDENHRKTMELLNGTTTRMTPNSGAASVKGDQEIQGLLLIMEELKQQTSGVLKGGNKSFSIQKKWLEKLNREAKAADKEFWYLKGSFGDTEDFPFIVIEPDLVMSMVYTMSEDRKAKIKAELDLDVKEKARRLCEAENAKLLAEVDYLKAKIKQLEAK